MGDAIDGKKLLRLTPKDIEDLGVQPFGIRKRMSLRIKEFKASCATEDNSTDEELEADRASVHAINSQVSWLPQGEQLWRLEFKRCPKEFREALLNSPELTTELPSGALVFVPRHARDYVERLVAKRSEDVVNLCGRDIICTCSLKPHVESVVASVNAKTKLSRAAPITATKSSLCQPSTVPKLTKDTVGTDVEFLRNGFLEVRHHVSSYAQSVASSTNHPKYGPRRNPRCKLAESQAWAPSGDHDEASP